jgi:hypothetical protein
MENLGGAVEGLGWNAFGEALSLPACWGYAWENQYLWFNHVLDIQ